ncbi:MAG: TetR/AcrR family transcriptional regulator [Ilumatobacteraceae bacterium]
MGRPKLRTPAVRADMLQEAMRLFERDGPGAVNARNVATMAGSSTGALYELFGDKSGLVRCLFFESFAALHSELTAVPTSDDPRADLVALLGASRSFSVSRPMLFDVMYSRPFAEFEPFAVENETGEVIYRLIVKAVARWLRSEQSTLSATEAAHVLVATHRGLVATELAGLLGTTRRARERRSAMGVEVVLDGLLQRERT